MERLHNTYLFKALDAYPYDIPETIENVTYALSYDAKEPLALGLAGNIHYRYLNDRETALDYYQAALAEDINALHIYPNYIQLVVDLEDFAHAYKLIDFAMTIKGANTFRFMLIKALALEKQLKFKEALAVLKVAKLHTQNNCEVNAHSECKTRIKSKLPKKKTKKKGANKNKKNGK